MKEDSVRQGTPVTNENRLGFFAVAATAIIMSIAANYFIIKPEGPVIGWSFLMLTIAILILIFRPHAPNQRRRIVALLLFAVTFFASMWNFCGSGLFVMWMLLFFLAGDGIRTDELRDRCASWIESAMDILRPLGICRVVTSLRKPKFVGTGFYRIVVLVLTTVALLVVFTFLLANGNAVLGKFVDEWWGYVRKFFFNISLPKVSSVIIWCFWTYIAVALIFPPKTSRLARKISGDWPLIPAEEPVFRVRMWIWGLAALNGLFLLTNGIDIVYLWCGAKLPDGVTFSGYVHEGVNVLSMTCLLSAGIMALLTQHPPSVRDNKTARVLCGVWMAQNIFMISGVLLRLVMYVDAYGYSPKRIYVACFLALVFGGYVFLAMALTRGHGLKWLAHSGVLLVFFYFFAVQFVDAEAISANRNLALYKKGEIAYPDNEFMSSIGSYKFPMLIAIASDESLPESDRKKASNELKLYSQQAYFILHGFMSSDFVSAWNYVALYKYPADAK